MPEPGTSHLYLVALGSNRRHHRHGRPREVLERAVEAIAARLGTVHAVSPFMRSDPVGPSLRRYANGALVLESGLPPLQLLDALKELEREFGRRKGGQRWISRVLDCDIVMWGGGVVAEKALQVPHRLFRDRDFVLIPAAAIAPDWRDPLTGFTVRQLLARLTGPRPLPRWSPSPDLSASGGP